MRIIINSEQNKMNSEWGDDNGKMRWVGTNIKGQPTISTAREHLETRKLRAKYQRRNWLGYTALKSRQQNWEWAPGYFTEVQ